MGNKYSLVKNQKTMFYIILNDLEKKVEGIYTDKSKAIIMRNFLLCERDGFDRKDIIIIETNNTFIDKESCETWTDIELSDVPLDFQIDVKKDLKLNNWISDKYDEEQKQKDILQKQKINKYTQDCDGIKEIIEVMKEKYRAQLSQMYEDNVEYEKQLNDCHAKVLESRKQERKNIITQDQLHTISEKESYMKKEMGSKKRKYTNQVKNVVCEAGMMLKKKNILAQIDTLYYYADKYKIHVFTITLNNTASFHMYLKD